MNWLDPQVILVFGSLFLLVYGTFAIIFMVLSLPAMRYRRAKYKDPEVLYRWLFIPILLPLRISYALVLLFARVGRAVLFFVAGALALLFAPLYFLLVRPVINFLQSFDEAMASPDKFVEVFERGIRLGHWVMFYKSEPITMEPERPKMMPPLSARPLKPSPKQQPDDDTKKSSD